MAYNIYQDDELIAEKVESKEHTVTGLTPNTEYSFSVSEIIGENESEKSDPAIVKTKYSDIESITVSPKTNNLEVGATRKLTAAVSPSTAKQEVSWSSNNGEVASVDASGTVKAVSAGQATITVTADGKSDSATVNVTEPEQPDGEG